jgi:antitoxin VapB
MRPRVGPAIGTGAMIAIGRVWCYISMVSDKEIGAMERAKIFWSGRSQAVRLPKSFRFPGKEVRIRRHANAVILEPVAADWAWLDAIAGKLDQDFAEAVDEHPGKQRRPALQRLFR